VLAVQPGGLDGADEELRAVGAWGHNQYAIVNVLWGV
jgi:hypothetical protein